MIIASLAIFPTSEGASVSRFVKEAVTVIRESGLHCETGGMSTIIEAPDMRSLLDVIAKAHARIVDMGARRIHIDLNVDHRLDKETSIAAKLRSLE